MSSIQPYLRQVELLIGPLPEWKGGGNSKQALRIYSDGSQDGLRISFSVHKHAMTTATPTIVSVYNLSAGLRVALQEPGAQIKMRVGWLNTELVDLFTGSLLAAVHKREGANIVTDLISLAGWGGVSRSITSTTFGKGVLIKDAVSQLANKIPGVTVDPKLINLKNTRIGSQGLSFVGSTEASLNKLSRVYGFTWWINDGVFYAKNDDRAFASGKVVISYKDGSLLRAEPMLASPMQIQAGVTIQSVLNPLIQPGHMVKLESGLNKKLNRDYVVHTLAHQGDTHGQQWQSMIESWIVLG